MKTKIGVSKSLKLVKLTFLVLVLLFAGFAKFTSPVVADTPTHVSNPPFSFYQPGYSSGHYVTIVLDISDMPDRDAALAAQATAAKSLVHQLLASVPPGKDLYFNVYHGYRAHYEEQSDPGRHYVSSESNEAIIFNYIDAITSLPSTYQPHGSETNANGSHYGSSFSPDNLYSSLVIPFIGGTINGDYNTEYRAAQCSKNYNTHFLPVLFSPTTISSYSSDVARLKNLFGDSGIYPDESSTPHINNNIIRTDISNLNSVMTAVGNSIAGVGSQPPEGTIEYSVQFCGGSGPGPGPGPGDGDGPGDGPGDGDGEGDGPGDGDGDGPGDGDGDGEGPGDGEGDGPGDGDGEGEGDGPGDSPGDGDSPSPSEVPGETQADTPIAGGTAGTQPIEKPVEITTPPKTPTPTIRQNIIKATAPEPEPEQKPPAESPSGQGSQQPPPQKKPSPFFDGKEFAKDSFKGRAQTLGISQGQTRMYGLILLAFAFLAYANRHKLLALVQKNTPKTKP